MTVTFSLVIPTIGRPTLARTLLSLRGQDWRPGDEVLLAGDGPREQARDLWGQLGLPGRYLETPRVLGHWGHGVRNWLNARRLARGTHLLALDDDDAYRAGALALARAAVAGAPGRCHLFRMRVVPVDVTVWADREVRHGNVGTPMFCAPNDPARLGTWGDRYGGDLDWITSTLAHYPGGPVWRGDVLCDVWPAKDLPRREED